MKLPLVLAFVALASPAWAQQPPPDDAPVTLTFGELNAIVNARVADALAGAAMKHLNMQLPAPAPPPSAQNFTPAPPKGRTLPPPAPIPQAASMPEATPTPMPHPE